MYRRSSEDVEPTPDQLADLISRADSDPRVHRVVGQVLQGAIHRGQAPGSAGPVSVDPADNVTPPVPVPLAPADYEPPPATFVTWGPAVGYDGYVSFTANGTYGAREYIKRVGGWWDKPRKRWLVPRSHAEYVAAVVEQSVLGKLPGADPGYRPGAPSDAKKLTQTAVCWVCGTGYTPVEFRARPHARIEDYYCGCCEPGAPVGTRRFRS